VTSVIDLVVAVSNVCQVRGHLPSCRSSPPFHQLQMLLLVDIIICVNTLSKAAERIDLKLAVLVYKCLHGVAPSYLANELCQSADFNARRRLRSASSSSLVVHCTRLSTVGDRAFSVTAAHVWNGLQQHITSAPSLSTFRSRLKTHLFQRCFP